MVTVKRHTLLKVFKIIKVYRIPNTQTSDGRPLENYIHAITHGEEYPRVHFSIVSNQKNSVRVFFHVDESRHKTDIFHPKIERIRNLFINS